MVYTVYHVAVRNLVSIIVNIIARCQFESPLAGTCREGSQPPVAWEVSVMAGHSSLSLRFVMEPMRQERKTLRAVSGRRYLYIEYR
jgi:hypothetical protein